MLDTNKFVTQLIANGYSHLCVVPCSFAKNLINAVINNNEIEYIACASEAVACSVATGLKMSNKKPIIIVQSSGLTNMGSCITSLLKPYNITLPIIVSWRTYKAGDSEIQHQHLANNLPNLIKAYGYQYKILNKNHCEQTVKTINQANGTTLICILEKSTFSEVALKPEHKLDLSQYPPRSQYLQLLDTKFNHSDTLFIGTTGNTAREMYNFMPNTNNFYMAGNMGGALSLGLGAAKAGKSVIICGGDAEFGMHMGGLTTTARYASQINLTYILFDNQSNKSTGGQNTYQNHINYCGIVKNSGFNNVLPPITKLSQLKSVINNLATGLNFLTIACSYDPESPRPPLNVVKINQF